MFGALSVRTALRGEDDPAIYEHTFNLEVEE